MSRGLAKVRSKVITCNRCGTNNPAGTIHCQRCGILLTQMGANGGNLEQPALPAWLESLRSDMGEAGSSGNAGSTPFTSENQSNSDFGDRNNNRHPLSGQLGDSSTKSDNQYQQSEQESPPPIFHASDLIDDNALPSWLRSVGEKGAAAQAPINNPETPQAQHTLRPASYAAPNTDESFFTGQENMNSGIAANSLVDEQALPPWMRQDQEAAPHDGQRPISAASLIQADAMPDWMKNMQGPPAYSGPSTPSSAFPQQVPGMPPSTDPFQAPQAAGQNLSAHDLIDPQSLPNWMKQQAGQGGPLPASSLIDQSALPQWMREESQRPPAASAFTPAPQGQQAPQAPPMNVGWQGNNGQIPSNPQHPIPASSFIDMNSLPPWLRQNEGGQSPMPQGSNQSGPSGQIGQQRPAYPVPPRSENMRVPSRPRSEMAPNEGSEVAANVFASMLGVASTTPNFPPTPQGYPGQQGPQGSPPTMPPMGNPQQAIPPYGNMGNMQSAQPAQGPANMPQQQPPQPPSGYMQEAYQGGNSGMQGPGNSPMGTPPAPSMYPAGNYSPGNAPSGNYPAGNYPMGNPPLMPPPNMGNQQPGMQNFGPNQYQYPPNAANMGNQGRSAMGNEQSPNAKPAKRNLFEAIRSWLSRS